MEDQIVIRQDKKLVMVVYQDFEDTTHRCENGQFIVAIQYKEYIDAISGIKHYISTGVDFDTGMRYNWGSDIEQRWAMPPTSKKEG